jgi:quercetin dioxygenase-like cupin family protein
MAASPFNEEKTMNSQTSIVAIGLAAMTSCVHAAEGPSVPAKSSEHMEIRRAETLPSTPGPAERFTGAVTVTQLFGPTERTRSSGGRVTFQPGARSAWHTHPAGQTLIITVGTGWVEEWGGPRQQVQAGDVVWTPPGVKHWHGAAATESMTHLAIQEQVDGSGVTWLEQVSDDQYGNELQP